MNNLSINSLFFLFCVASIFGVCSGNCTSSKGEIACFTCMGRDMENCMSGTTCCKGACFKLEDIKHNVIVKGCEVQKEEDASMKVRQLNIPLYWADKEKVKGESFFCTGKDYCNSSNNISNIFGFLIIIFLSFRQ